MKANDAEKTFPIGAILSVVYGKLLCSLEALYEILNYLTGDNLFTHQLPRASEAMRTKILDQLPQLVSWAEHDALVTTDNWAEMLSLAEQLYERELSLTPVGCVWNSIDPLQELYSILGTAKGDQP